jgi:hypothetical protein
MVLLDSGSINEGIPKRLDTNGLPSASTCVAWNRIGHTDANTVTDTILRSPPAPPYPIVLLRSDPNRSGRHCKPESARRGAHLASIDESGFLLIPNVRKTRWLVRQTPRLRRSFGMTKSPSSRRSFWLREETASGCTSTCTCATSRGRGHRVSPVPPPSSTRPGLVSDGRRAREPRVCGPGDRAERRIESDTVADPLVPSPTRRYSRRAPVPKIPECRPGVGPAVGASGDANRR